MMELSREQMDKHLATKNAQAVVFLYTPLCGTCKVAERMLSVVETLLPGLSIYRANLNLLPELAQNWQVTSVPCLLILQQGEVYKRSYAMKSVPDLLQFLSP